MLDRQGHEVVSPRVADGWTLETLVAESALIGANGMRQGPDGRLYVAQAFGNQISAVDLSSGQADVISPADGKIIAPDDLAFDSRGNLFATEVMSERVSAIRPNGTIDVIAANVPVANGVTVHADRIFMSEFRPGGRILELSADGAAPRVLAENLLMPNALSMGPDGCLYFPLVPLGEVWRVPAAGGVPEKVVGGFSIPTAVKFDQRGALFVVECGTGAINRVDVQTGAVTPMFNSAVGIDNLAFSTDGELFVSHFTDGGITGFAPSGTTRTLVKGSMLGPFGMTVSPGGELVIADGMSLSIVDQGGSMRRPSMLLQHGFPGYVRGVAAMDSGCLLCSNSAGSLMRYAIGDEAVALAEGLHEAMGVMVADDGSALVCEGGAGRVLRVTQQGDISTLASGLQRPIGICAGPNGTMFVSEASAGRVVALTINGESSTVVDKLIEPHGLSYRNGQLSILDRGARALHVFDVESRAITTVATALPTGMAIGRRMNTLPGIAGLLPGPLSAFADLAHLPDGRLCIGCDGDGSIRSLTRH